MKSAITSETRLTTNTPNKGKKRILILNYEFPPLGGGASPVSYEISKGYAKLGHYVSVVTMHYKGLPKYEFKDGMHIYRVPCIRSKKEICHPWEQLSYIFSAKRFLKQHLKTHTYDINHTHFIIPTGIISLWLKNNYNIPYIITSHGSDVPGYNPDRFKLLHKFTKPTIRKILKNAKLIISPSNYLANLIKSELGNFSITIIPNGIDTETFKPRKKKKIILSTGRLLKRKGFHILINTLKDKDIGYELHMVGDGPMMKELKELSKNSKTKVVFHGWIDNKSKRYKDLLETAKVYALLSERENSSISLLEAMSAGCAVITSNVSGCPETIGNAGWALNLKDPNLSKTVKDILNDTDKIRKFSSLSRQRVVKEYNSPNLIKIYEQKIS